MTRLAERLGYLWQRYVAWRSPRPFEREPEEAGYVSKPGRW
jgi:hypothetical protein